ncbi:MAG: excinuclease ABC subunit UvrB [Candidatus Harrisonbacteria bacterium]|nr:excinuclease ABC subunit UvrB [Candidatus Harrisonbacteria bacterium]
MFKLVSNFKPKGDQPQAIEKLVEGIEAGHKNQVLLGVTGSGKTFTMASVIEKIGLPTLIVSPNKTLAAQLYQEFKQFFPNNAVHYFVSYYDYYQPEAFIPQTNTYIQKDARINQEIDKLRHAAIQSVLSRKDTIVIASVSCIYGIGDPTEYQKARFELKTGQNISLKDLERTLIFLQYERTGKFPLLGQFRILKTAIEIYLVTGELIHLELAGKRIKFIKKVDPKTKAAEEITSVKIFPAKFWVTPQQKLKLALKNIKAEMDDRVEELQSAGKFLEADRLEKRTKFDLEMLAKKGYINGIENYSRHLSFRELGEPPMTLLDYFPRPFLLFIDESHIAIPQLQGMEHGDRQRKQTLVEYGFRLPSALDNRPLKFGEFSERIGQVICVSATPGLHEIDNSNQIVEQLVRPTGILDPQIEIRSAKNQVKDLVGEIKNRVEADERVLALTLTKRSAEDLTEYLLNQRIKAQYLHSEIKTLKRPEVLQALRRGDVDVVVGINLLREGLDLPEVSLVAILDADREGFLRNYRGLIQMAGRAARSINGKVILYADLLTNSIKKTMAETLRRRKIQEAFNKKIGVVPRAIKKEILEPILARGEE